MRSPSLQHELLVARQSSPDNLQKLADKGHQLPVTDLDGPLYQAVEFLESVEANRNHIYVPTKHFHNLQKSVTDPEYSQDRSHLSKGPIS